MIKNLKIENEYLLKQLETLRNEQRNYQKEFTASKSVGATRSISQPHATPAMYQDIQISPVSKRL